MRILFLLLAFSTTIIFADENSFPLKIKFNLPKDKKIADGTECNLYNEEPFGVDISNYKEGVALYDDLRKSPISLRKVTVGNFEGIINKQIYLKNGEVTVITVDLLERQVFRGKIVGQNNVPLEGIFIALSSKPFSRSDKCGYLNDLREKGKNNLNDFSDKEGLFNKFNIDNKKENYFLIVDSFGNSKEFKVLPENIQGDDPTVFDFTPISDLKLKFTINNGTIPLKLKIKFNLYDLNEYGAFNIKDRMITDENGEVLLTQLKETDYTICVESEKYINKRMQIKIKRGVIQELFYDLVDASYIKGKINCANQEFRNLQLTLQTEDLRQNFTAKINSDGVFEFGGLDPTLKYKLFTALQGYINDESTPKFVQPPIENLELKFIKIPSIIGFANDFDGSPAKFFRVSIAKKVGNKFTVYANKIPFTEGKFIFQPNNLGWHEVQVYISNSVVFKKKFEVSEKGVSEKLEFRAEIGKKIFGKVENSLGEPIEGAYIQEEAPIYDNSGPYSPFAYTDKQGKFSIENQGLGNELYVKAKYYSTKKFVLSNEFLSEGLIVLDKGFTVKGVLKNQYNLPIDKVQVSAKYKSKEIIRSVLSETDKDGKYELDSMIPGDWIMEILVIQKDGKQLIKKEVSIFDKDVELNLEAIVPESK